MPPPPLSSRRHRRLDGGESERLAEPPPLPARGRSGRGGGRVPAAAPSGWESSSEESEEPELIRLAEPEGAEPASFLLVADGDTPHLARPEVHTPPTLEEPTPSTGGGAMPAVQQRLVRELADKAGKVKMSLAEYVRHEFRKCDVDASGELDAEELKVALQSLQIEVSDAEVTQLAASLDTDHDGDISIEEFCELLDSRLKQLRDKLRAASYTLKGVDLPSLFKHYDRDNSGELEFSEFKTAVRRDAKLSADQISDGELLELFSIGDVDQNGSIEMDEFIQLLSDPATAKREQHKRASSAAGQVYGRILKALSAEKQGSQAQIMRVFELHAQNGRLDRSGLRKVAKELGATVASNEEIDEMVTELSVGTTDGTITPEAFAGRLRQAKKDAHALAPKVRRTASVQHHSAADLELAKKSLKGISAGQDPRKLFSRYDRDRSGALDFAEFRMAVRKGARIPPAQLSDDALRQLFTAADADGSGDMSIEELTSFIWGDDVGEFTPSSPRRVQLTAGRGSGSARASAHAGTPPRQSPRRAPLEASTASSDAANLAYRRIIEHADSRHVNLMHLFHRYDPNGTGSLDRKQFRKALENLGLKLNKSEFQQVMADLDDDGDGSVTAKEFSDRMKLAKRQVRQQTRTPRPSARRTRSKQSPLATHSPQPEPEPELRADDDAAAGQARKRLSPHSSPRSSRGVDRRSNSKLGRTLSTGSQSSGQWFPTRAWVDVVQPPAMFINNDKKLVVASEKSYATHLEDGMKRLCSKILTHDKMHEAFEQLDVDGSGEVELSEFRQALKELGVYCNEPQIVSLFRFYDADGGGTISVDEFVSGTWKWKQRQMWTVIGDAIEAVGGIDLERLFRHAAEATSAMTGGTGSSGAAPTSPRAYSSRLNVDLDVRGLHVEWEPFRRAMRRSIRLSQHALSDEALYGIFEFACRLDDDPEAPVLAQGSGSANMKPSIRWKAFRSLLTAPDPEESVDPVSVVDRIVLRVVQNAEAKQVDVQHLFDAMDDHGSGGLDAKQVQRAMAIIDVPTTPKELKILMQELDPDATGLVLSTIFAERMRLCKKKRVKTRGARGRDLSSPRSPRGDSKTTAGTVPMTSSNLHSDELQKTSPAQVSSQIAIGSQAAKSTAETTHGDEEEDKAQTGEIGPGVDMSIALQAAQAQAEEAMRAAAAAQARLEAVASAVAEAKLVSTAWVHPDAAEQEQEQEQQQPLPSQRRQVTVIARRKGAKVVSADTQQVAASRQTASQIHDASTAMPEAEPRPQSTSGAEGIEAEVEEGTPPAGDILAATDVKISRLAAQQQPAGHRRVARVRPRNKRDVKRNQQDTVA